MGESNIEKTARQVVNNNYSTQYGTGMFVYVDV